MTAIRTARDRARAELTREIKDEARRQLAAEGAARLSLRAVARTLGMASSALYRYFPSRDDLLTALIIDAYDALGDAVARATAESPPEDHAGRWRAMCHAVRGWASGHPHEYALVYGSPVPGYQAPTATVAPASRIPLLLLEAVRDCWKAGLLAPPSDEPPLSAAMAAEADHLAGVVGMQDVPAAVLTRVVVAWTQLFGMVSLELFGHTAGAFHDDAVVFAEAVELMAHFVGFQRHHEHSE